MTEDLFKWVLLAAVSALPRRWQPGFALSLLFAIWGFLTRFVISGLNGKRLPIDAVVVSLMEPLLIFVGARALRWVTVWLKRRYWPPARKGAEPR